MRRITRITFICAWRNDTGALACQAPAAFYVSGLEHMGDTEERVFCKEHADLMAAIS